MTDDRNAYPPVDPIATGMRCRCPRCGEGKLLSGLSVRDGCTVCGLDFAFTDEGDGPTVFIILALGLIVLGGALFVEFTYEPAVWVHILLWPPIILVLGIPAIRMVKGVLIAQQYVHDAAPGRISDD